MQLINCRTGASTVREQLRTESNRDKVLTAISEASTRLRSRLDLTAAEVGGQDLLQRAEVGFVGGDRRDLPAFVGRHVVAGGVEILEVVEAEVEMNHVPLARTEPLVEGLEAARGVAAIFRRA